MKTKKQHLRHHILNIFTIMNYRISDEETYTKNKEEIQKLLKTATFFVEHEDIFLGQKPTFFKQKSSLKSLLEMLHEIHHEGKSSHEITLPVQDIEIEIDQYYIGEALGYLIENLYKKTHEVRYKIDPENHSLKISHSSDFQFNENNNEEWFKEKSDYFEISLWLSKNILKNFGVEIRSQKNEISLIFPKI